MMRILPFVLACICSLPVLAAESPPAPPPQATTPAPQTVPAQSWIGVTPTPYGPILMQQAPPPPYRDYQMNRILTPEERARWLQMAMPMMAHLMQMDAREAMNYFAVKYKVKPGVSFDQVVESMMLRANQVNLKYVGKNEIWKEFRAVLHDDKAPRVEVFSFCDIAVGRELLKVIPEIIVFLPCRIAVMEDADKNIWVLTLDWDVTWLDQAGKQAGITPELRKGAMEIREKLDSVMRAGADGEL
ncbi:MAG: DUF302 domain-containing protein [Hyphomicrobiaceae bacterium]